MGGLFPAKYNRNGACAAVAHLDCGAKSRSIDRAIARKRIGESISSRAPVSENHERESRFAA
jgi:hypothetical protein